MFQTETALPGETEIETSYGPLLLHRDDRDCLVLTTGLDPDRIEIEGRRYLAHGYVFPDGPNVLKHNAGLIDVETRMPAPSDVCDRFIRSLMEALDREAVPTPREGFIPSPVDPETDLVRKLRTAEGAIIRNFEYEQNLDAEFHEAYRRDPDINYDQPFYWARTKLGPVRIEFGENKVHAYAGDALTPFLKGPRTLLGHQKLAIWATMPLRDGRIDMDAVTGPRALFHFKVLDGKEGREIRDQELADDLRREVAEGAQALLDRNPAALEDAARRKRAQATANLREKLENVDKVRDNLFEIRDEYRQRLEMKAPVPSP